MLKFFANLFAAQRNAKALSDLEGKFRNVVSHATAGNTSDITRPLNDIAVTISSVRNDVWQHAQESKVKELLHDLERKLLAELQGEYAYPIKVIAERIGAVEGDVRAVMRTFAIKGLAVIAPLYSEDEGTFRGRGYLLTADGEAFARSVAA